MSDSDTGARPITQQHWQTVSGQHHAYPVWLARKGGISLN
jgi:hypothetical protein